MSLNKKKGGRWCSAPNCKNNSNTHADISFFGFPKDKERSMKWVVNSRREDLLKRDSTYLNKNCTICSVHFESACFLNFLQNRLKPDAVPTIFNVPNPPRQLAPKRKAPTERITEPCQVAKKSIYNEQGPASSSSSGNDTVVIDEGNCIVLPLDGPPVVSFENMGALSPEESESPEFMMVEETLPTSSSVPSPSVSRATSICNGNSAKKPVKRKHSTENVQEDIDLKMLKLSERQVKAAEDTLELQRKYVERQMDLQERQMDLQERQTIAMENASRAIIGAMKVMEMFIKRQAGEGDVPGDQL